MNAPFEVVLHPDLEYCQHGGVSLRGDLFMPGGLIGPPIMIVIHGGAWKGGSPSRYAHWGSYLAARGIAMFAIEYRLVKNAANRYPASVHDAGAAVRFIRSNAERLQLDPDRIGIMGHSAGGYLSAMIGLAADKEPFASGLAGDVHANISTRVKVVVGIAGIYDMLAQWQHDLAIRPRDNMTENYLGVSAIDDKFAYFSASPLAYVTPKKDGPAFLISGGTCDDIVDWETQAKPFAMALRQAQFDVQLLPVLGAGHYFLYGPLDVPGGQAAFLADELVRFLKDRL